MKKGYSLLLVGLFLTSLYIVKPTRTHSYDPFFTLSVRHVGGGDGPDYLNLIKQQLLRIGINLDVHLFDWGAMIPESDYWTTPWDMQIASFGGYSRKDPDFTGVYNENGSLNFFSYHTSMDWDEELGTGKNEWYIKTGREILPPYSQERINHYWEWEDYLMDKILPVQPLIIPMDYMASWIELEGYNYSKGIIQSWGNMNWEYGHTGQISTNEVVIADELWENLNPIFHDDSASDFITSACLDPLFWYDEDLRVWPHLAEELIMVNDTQIRIKCRQGIQWHDDPDEIFMNEIFDAEDVYLTLYCWKYLSRDRHLYYWLEDMEIVDQYTIDLFLKNSEEYSGWSSYAPVQFMPRISTKIIPEHYLNQTQLVDGKTPNITHSSWEKYSTNCFGTGLFELSDFDVGVETILAVNPQCWWLNSMINNDPMLDWNKRFGDFSGYINQLRIRLITDSQTRLQEFEAGKLDLSQIETMPEFFIEPEIDVQLKKQWKLTFLGYNMRENRQYVGSREPCPLDSAISIGLAIRKAISYAMNREEMNKIIHGGDYYVSDQPIYERMGIWCNPNIIRYNHDLDKAREYMTKAGYDLGWTPTFDLSLVFVICGITLFFAVATLFVKSRKRRSN